MGEGKLVLQQIAFFLLVSGSLHLPNLALLSARKAAGWRVGFHKRIFACTCMGSDEVIPVITLNHRFPEEYECWGAYHVPLGRPAIAPDLCLRCRELSRHEQWSLECVASRSVLADLHAKQKTRCRNGENGAGQCQCISRGYMVFVSPREEMVST